MRNSTRISLAGWAISILVVPAALVLFAPPVTAQPYEASYFSEMRWRSIGPYRGGRTRAVAGVPSQPNVLYIGVCNGGVWKTTDYGRTWRPIFDDQPTGSIGAVAVAPSNPNIVYVASGEGLQRPDLSVGDGIYRSTDAGRTWTHLGLRDGQQIPQLIVDPRNPDRLFAAVLGHPYGPNIERGIYRSLDGGAHFERVLYKDENTGGSELAFDPSNPGINGWDPERKSNFGYYYNVQATPLIYILDRDKKIIAKKIGVQDIGPFIENYRKYFRK